MTPEEQKLSNRLNIPDFKTKMGSFEFSSPKNSQINAPSILKPIKKGAYDQSELKMNDNDSMANVNHLKIRSVMDLPASKNCFLSNPTPTPLHSNL
jgi:hypothetical protein